MQTNSLHSRVEALTGADMRIYYGVGIPVVVVVATVVALALSASWWMLVAATLVLVLLTGVVVVGFLQMLDDPE